MSRGSQAHPIGERPMPTLHFCGRLLPEKIVNLTVHHRAKTTWTIPDLGITPVFEVIIENSKIDVIVESDQYARDLHFVALYTRAQDLVRVDINLASFATGFALRSILDSYSESGGPEMVIVVHNPRLAELCTAYRLDDISFDETHHLVLNSLQVNFILNDLIGAINAPHAQAIAAERLSETVRLPRIG